MKGKIFIGWSGNNEIALNISKKLYTYGYEGIVGGQTGQDKTLFLGDSIISEINYCNQAIFVIQKKSDNSISGNLLFELGYSLSRFASNKVHVFYVDIQNGDPMIPTDISGIWAKFISAPKSDEDIENIVACFLKNQKTIITENKMEIVDSYFESKPKMINYAADPFCSEYEFAQYVLFFAQAAYLFDDTKNAYEVLNNITNKLKKPAKEVEFALSFAVYYVNIFNHLKRDKNAIYVSREVVRDIRKEFSKMIDVVFGWEKNDFTCWLLIMLYDAMNYAFILYSCNPEVLENDKRAYLKKSIEYAELCLECCSHIENYDDNTQYLHLMRAYMYRNLSTAYSVLTDIEDAKKKEIENLRLSSAERGLLLGYYKMHNICEKLKETFEMEYFLVCSEYLKYMDDDFDREESREDCIEYIQKTKQTFSEKNFFLSRIETLVNT